LRLTPARAATSRIVGRLPSFTPALHPVRRLRNTCTRRQCAASVIVTEP
jgi:hypothetical protein